jgi:hypothetical protein
MAMSRRERCKEIHQRTVGMSSVVTTSKSQRTPFTKEMHW